MKVKRYRLQLLMNYGILKLKKCNKRENKIKIINFTVVK